MEMHESAQRAAEKIWQHVEPMERGAFALLDVEAIIDRECRVSELRDALEYLHAEQEGPPSLKSHRLRAWCAAMAKAESLLFGRPRPRDAMGNVITDEPEQIP